MTPRLAPLRRTAPAQHPDLTDTAADEDIAVPAPTGAHWGPRRVEPPHIRDDMREMGIDAAAARAAWHSAEYAAGHDDGMRDGYGRGWSDGAMLALLVCLVLVGLITLGVAL